MDRQTRQTDKETGVSSTDSQTIGCFLRHIIQSNLLYFNVSSFKCLVLISLSIFFIVKLMRYVIILIKLLCMYVCVYV